MQGVHKVLNFRRRHLVQGGGGLVTCVLRPPYRRGGGSKEAREGLGEVQRRSLLRVEPSFWNVVPGWCGAPSMAFGSGSCLVREACSPHFLRTPPASFGACFVLEACLLHMTGGSCACKNSFICTKNCSGSPIALLVLPSPPLFALFWRVLLQSSS